MIPMRLLSQSKPAGCALFIAQTKLARYYREANDVTSKLNTFFEDDIKENVSRVSLDNSDGDKKVRSSKWYVIVPVCYAEPSTSKELRKGEIVYEKVSRN